MWSFGSGVASGGPDGQRDARGWRSQQLCRNLDAHTVAVRARLVERGNIYRKINGYGNA
jgi:hypothetical protein